jgi:transposase
MSQRQRFTQALKLAAVQLLKQSGRPAAAIARELGIPQNRLYKWAADLDTNGAGAFPGFGRAVGTEDEVVRLRRENARLKEERDIFKKAAAYCAKDLP